MKRSRPLFPEVPPEYPPNLSFLLSLSPSVFTLGLRNIRCLLHELGDPQNDFKAVLVAGSNGKGSVTAFLSSILKENGLRVGRYISPHVYSVTERVSIQDNPISIEQLEEYASLIAPLHGKIRFSYFEGLTAAAFLAFAQEGVDYAVLEVGLGGRFDATNVVDPVLCILTGVTLDHRKLLGDHEEEIILEKLGITRKGVPLLCGRLQENLLALVSTKARRDKFPLQTFESIGENSIEHISCGAMQVQIRTKMENHGALSLPFPGSHQADNALLAAAAAEMLLGRTENIKTALENAYLPGRFEYFPVRGKRFILDVAHNDQALLGSLSTLTAVSPAEENALVLGMMKRKEFFAFPSKVPAAAKRLYLVEPEDKDACSPQELLARIGLNNLKSTGMDVMVINADWKKGEGERFLDHLLDPLLPLRTILITGSHRTVELFGKLLEGGRLL
jgi:dihydrofolate synthase/folylpolyglutamate synthase